MRLPLVGPSNVEASLNFDAQRTINLYASIDPTGQGKEKAALYGTPGTNLRIIFIPGAGEGDGPVRALFDSTNGRAFAVSNAGLYEILNEYLAVRIGTLLTNSTHCSMTENTTQLAICDGRYLYTYTYSTGVFAQVTDADLPLAGTVTFQDGYFIINRVSYGQFYISTLENGSSWDALDFATAESSPDNLVRVFAAYGQLYLFGERTTEVYYNSGNADFPFSRIEGAKLQVGCAAAHSVVDADNSILWLSHDKYGRGIVYQMRGYSPTRISTHAIERLLQQAESLEDVRAYAYQKDGHLFYVLNGSALGTTLVYDISTKLWHERAYLESDGSLSPQLYSTCMHPFGEHLVGDRTSGKLYHMSDEYFDDADNAILSQRTLTHLHKENERFRVNELQIDFESGVGLTETTADIIGSDPVVWLETSGDGGKTWGPQLPASIGKLGEYGTRATWRRLGLFEMFTARVSITDPVKRAICGAYLK